MAGPPPFPGPGTGAGNSESRNGLFMKILFYECFAGISGDMNLAAMIDLGVEPGYLRAELSRLGLDDEFELRIEPGAKMGVHGTQVDVVLKHDGHCRDGHCHAGQHHGEGGRHHEPAHVHDHEHDHHDPHGHHHGHGHADLPHSHDGLRGLADIEAILAASSLSEPVRETSLAIFRKVAEAEAKVHGKELYEVHFHEVGATDSIVDIVGAAICFHRLREQGVEQVWASPVELGGGFARCAHGLIPVPAPATVEILRGVPTTRGKTNEEAATPTGAAILAVLAERFTATPALAVERTAYGVGHRDVEIPNVLRVNLAETDEAADEAGKNAGAPLRSAPIGGTRTGEARLLQCNIDDMTPELLGATMDLLMDQGAMDVHFTPIQMKKNRPAVMLSLLCGVEEEERFKDQLFRHTTTLGIKTVPVGKTVLEVHFEKLETPLGVVTMKNAILDGKVIRSKPELEDCKRLAREHGIPLGEVYYHIGKCRK